MMRLSDIMGILCAVVIIVSCKSNDFSESGLKGSTDKDNRLPLNAYLLWRDGKGAPIFDFPSKYPNNYWTYQNEGSVPDEVFFVPKETYFLPNGEKPKTTEGVRLKGDAYTPWEPYNPRDKAGIGVVLTYPKKEGRTLAIKFYDPVGKKDHKEAAKYCQSFGLRLPFPQELLDYCAAGTKRNKEGFYPESRCKMSELLEKPHTNIWSLSIVREAEDSNSAWWWSSSSETINSGGWRPSIAYVVCVGLP